MTLEQAIHTVYDTVRDAMASDYMIAELLKSSGELFDASKQIIVFAIDLLQGKRALESPGTDDAGRRLYSLLADATDSPQPALDPAEAIGPLGWIAIARMLMELLTRLRNRG